MKAPSTIRVALVDDSEADANEARELIQQEPGIACVAICSTMAAAREQLPALAPDVVLLAIELPDGSGVDLLAELSPRMPKTDFIVLTAFDDPETIETAIRNGAAGYLLKRSGRTQIIRAVRRVREGGAPLDDEISRSVVDLIREQPRLNNTLPELTAQENRLLLELSQGATMKEAAATIGVTYSSARTYVRRMYAKLGVHNRMEAARRFLHLTRRASDASTIGNSQRGSASRAKDGSTRS